jgi:hypothetical protein
MVTATRFASVVEDSWVLEGVRRQELIHPQPLLQRRGGILLN